MKSKFFFVFFAVAALLCCFIFSASAGYDIDTDNILELDQVDSLFECLAKADVDNSGKIEASDARVILRVSVNLENIDTSAFMKADIDEDGKITAQDARIALRLSVGLDEIPKHNVESFVVVPATCNTEGLTVKVCTSCVKIYAQITEPASDEYHIPGNWETVTANSCVQEGLAIINCSHCGEKIKELKLPATGIHKLSDWTYPEGKNCERDMPKLRSCENCDYSEKATEPAGHDYKYIEVQKKTCVQDGIEVYKCAECGKEGVDSNGKTVYTHKAAGYHNFENTPTVLEAPTCTKEGKASYLCIFCDEPQGEIVLPANGHKYNKYYQVTLEPTCTEKGAANAVCEVCGEEISIELDMIEHDIDANGWTELFAPTCTETGEKEGYCRYCRDIVTVEIPEKGHSISSWENVKPATCSEPGIKKGICSICGETDVTQETEKLAHTFDRNTKYWYEGVPCQGPWKYYNKCIVCDAKEYYLTYETKNCTSLKNGVRQTRLITEATCTKAETIVEVCVYCKEDITGVRSNGRPLGHDYPAENWAVTTEPTCTETGLKEAACSRNCGEISKEVIPANGHAYSEYVITVEPSCFETGVKVKTCTVCGATHEDPVPLIAHTYGTAVTTLEPTCTETGIKTKTCIYCPATTDIEIPATGHSHGEYIVTVEPKCIEPGVKTSYCENCDSFIEEAIPATGHTYGDFITTLEPSCEQPGTKTRHCEKCDSTIDRPIPATGHTYGEFVTTVEPTCTETGTKTKSCINCDSKIDRPVPATGHTYGGFITTLEPTCTETGIKTKTCTSCDAEITEVIPTTEHTQGNFVVTKEPTCKEFGLSTSSCTVCGKVFDTVEIDKVPHTPVKEIIADSGSTDENGNYIVRYKTLCSVCGEDLNEESIIEFLSVQGGFDIAFTEVEGTNAGDNITFTVANGETDVLVMYSYGKDNTVILEATDGEYSFTVPEDLNAEDTIFIIVFALN